MLAKSRTILHQLQLLAARLTTNDIVVIAGFFANEVDGLRLFLTFPCHCSILKYLFQRDDERRAYACVYRFNQSDLTERRRLDRTLCRKSANTLRRYIISIQLLLSTPPPIKICLIFKFVFKALDKERPSPRFFKKSPINL